MHWILQSNLFHEKGWQDLVDTLERFNIPYSVHKVVPFVGELVPEPEVTHKNVICMGSYSMRHAAKKYGWNPGVFDLEPFDFTVQLKHWGKEMLNHDAVVSRFEDANFDEPEVFIRPIHDSKVFAGKVYTKEEFYDWKRKVCVLEHDYGDSLGKDTLIQVCQPKKIYSEHRFWVVNRQVVASSTYKIGWTVKYQPVIDQRYLQYVDKILRMKDERGSITLNVLPDGWMPHDAFVIDIADTEEGLKVVEINTLNSSGFYAANMTDLVMALENGFNQK